MVMVMTHSMAHSMHDLKTYHQNKCLSNRAQNLQLNFHACAHHPTHNHPPLQQQLHIPIDVHPDQCPPFPQFPPQSPPLPSFLLVLVPLNSSLASPLSCSFLYLLLAQNGSLLRRQNHSLKNLCRATSCPANLKHLCLATSRLSNSKNLCRAISRSANSLKMTRVQASDHRIS